MSIKGYLSIGGSSIHQITALWTRADVYDRRQEKKIFGFECLSGILHIFDDDRIDLEYNKMSFFLFYFSLVNMFIHCRFFF